MCMCPHHKDEIVNNDDNDDDALPIVLLALTRLERRADSDYESIKDCWQQIEEIEGILSKLTNTHLESDSYASYLFERTEQLSQHFETYKKIIGKVQIGTDVQDHFGKVSDKINQYLSEREAFKNLWFDCFEMIETGKTSIREKVESLNDLKTSVELAYQNQNFFDLSEFKEKFDEELSLINQLVECCFDSSKQCKEFTSRLHDNLLEMESCFQNVVKESMNRIMEIKQRQIQLNNVS